MFKKLNLSVFLQSRVNTAIFSMLPFTLSRWYIAFLGTLYHVFNRRSNCEIKAGIREAIQKPGNFRPYFHGIYLHYHEKLFASYYKYPKMCRFLLNNVKFIGLKHFHEAINTAKGVLLVTGHFGGVELLPPTLALHGYPTSMVVRFKTARLRRSATQRAEAMGLNLIDADDGNVLSSMLDALAKGNIVITECDEFKTWRPAKGKTSHFLANTLPYDRTLDVIQKRSGATVLFVSMLRIGGNQYACSFSPLTRGEYDPWLNGPRSVHTQCLDILERTVQQFPEQWYQWRGLAHATR